VSTTNGHQELSHGAAISGYHPTKFVRVFTKVAQFGPTPARVGDRRMAAFSYRTTTAAHGQVSTCTFGISSGLTQILFGSGGGIYQTRGSGSFSLRKVGTLDEDGHPQIDERFKSKLDAWIASADRED
jgi:hypothetical protein